MLALVILNDQVEPAGAMVEPQAQRFSARVPARGSPDSI